MGETVVITSTKCPSCQLVKELVAKKNVRIVDIETPEGEALLKKCEENGLDVRAVPDCIILSDGKFRRCNEQEQDDLLKQ